MAICEEKFLLIFDSSGVRCFTRQLPEAEITHVPSQKVFLSGVIRGIGNKLKGAFMSELVVLGFDGVGTADLCLTHLRALQKQHLIDLDDACVVIRNEKGKMQVKQAVNLTALGATSGAGTGMLMGALAGLLLFNPLAGTAIGGLAGAGMGALSGSMADFGINDEFVQELGQTIPEKSSALFVLVKSSTPDKVLPEIEAYNPRVWRTSLSNEQERRLAARSAAVSV